MYIVIKEKYTMLKHLLNKDLQEMKASVSTNLASQFCIVDRAKATLANLISHIEVISSSGKFFI